MPARPVAGAPERNPGPKTDGPERLARLQRDFAAHIRDPDGHAAPVDVEDRRMAIYRRLFFNNVSSLLASNFPVLRSLCDDNRWAALVREFYAEHRCQTPLFPELAGEFLRYLQDVRGTRPADPPFLLELAHYEWVELALSLDERELDDVPADPAGDLLQGCPVLSPLARALTYRYPVHRIRFDLTTGKREEGPAEQEIDEIKFHHATENGDAIFDLADESAGTRNLLILAGPVLDMLSKGLVLVVDELDTSLHTLLVQELVHLFHRQHRRLRVPVQGEQRVVDHLPAHFLIGEAERGTPELAGALSAYQAVPVRVILEVKLGRYQRPHSVRLPFVAPDECALPTAAHNVRRWSPGCLTTSLARFGIMV